MYNVQNTSWHLTLDRIAQVEVSEAEQALFGLMVGDLLVSRVNSFELVGKCAWVGPEGNGYMFENMLIRVKLNQTVDSLFIAQQMNIPFVRKQIHHVAKRAIGQSSINSADLRGISIKMPNLETQRSISCAIEIQMRQISQAQEYLQAQLDAINQLPATLLQQAFTGNI